MEEVREILFYLDPLIRSQSGGAEAETLIKSLQELDGGLGQYRLTSSLRLRLKEVMMDSIRREVGAVTRGRILSAETMQEMAPVLLRNLTKERQWSELVLSVRQEVGVCSRVIAESLTTEGEAGLEEKMSQVQLTGGSGPESLGSTWQQANFIMVRPEELRKLSGEMVSGESEKVRIEALNTLLLSQISDLTASQHWPLIKAGYRKCLSDQSHQVSSLSIKFHARLMMSGSHFAIKEGFLNLLQTVADWFSDKKLSSALPVSEISRESHLHQTALDLISLALSMAADLPKTWIRFPQTFVQEIIESMIEFLSVRSLAGQYSPLTLVSVVDHQADWLRGWLHSKISRTILMRKLSSSRHLVRSIQQDIVNYIEKTTFQHYEQVRTDIKEIREKPEFSSLNGNIVEFVSFLHKVSFVLNILTYKSGEEVVEEKEKFLSSIVQFILLPNTAKHPGRYITERLRTLIPHNTDLFIPFTEILSSRETQSSDVIVNALCILEEQTKLSPTSEKIFSSILSVYLKFDEVVLVRSTVKSIMRQSSRFPVTFTFPSWRKLMEEVSEKGEEQELYHELHKSGRLFYLTGFREIYLEDERNTSLALSSRTTIGAQLLLKRNVFKEKIENLSRLIHGEDEAKIRFSSDDVEEEEAVQDLMMILCSSQFVVSQSKERSGLRLVLCPGSEEASMEWRVAMLRLVLSLATNLDGLIAAEQKFHIFQIIESRLKDYEDVLVVDEEFLYLRYIHNMINNIGGPLETRRCSLSLPEEETEPRGRSPPHLEPLSSNSKPLDAFLEDESRVLDLGWIQTAAGMLRELLATNQQISTGQVVRLLERFSIINNNPATESPRIEVIDTTDDTIGLNMIIKYGMNIAVLDTKEEAGHKTRLAELVKVSRSMFPVGSFDWFVSAVFLVTGGEVGVTRNLMEALPDLLLAPLLWHNSGAARQENLHLLTVGFATELVLDSELPALVAFLNTNNIPVSALLDIWLRQCFINILNIEDVKSFIIFALVFGADYLVYFCVSVLYHIQEDLIESEEENTNIFQKMITLPVAGFSATDYLPYMDILSKKHRDVIMQYFTSILE